MYVYTEAKFLFFSFDFGVKRTNVWYYNWTSLATYGQTRSLTESEYIYVVQLIIWTCPQSLTNCSASLFIQINYINPHKEDKRPLLTRNVNFVHIHMVYTFFLLYRPWVTGCSKIEGWSKTKRKTAIMRPLKKTKKGIKLWTKVQINNTNWPIL